MHYLLVKSRKLDLPIDLQLKLFDHTVAPILLYGSETWGYENHGILEKVHFDFMRKITKAKSSTPHYMLYGELGRYPLSLNIKTRMVNFWNKLLCSENNKLSVQVYNFMITDVGRDYKWLNYVKNIFHNSGNSIIWFTQNFNKVKHIHKLIKSDLKDQFIQEWNNKLNKSSKGMNYNLYKKKHRFETYLTQLPL